MPYYPDKVGQLILLDIVNDLQQNVYQLSDLTFGLPEPSINHSRNTVVAAQPPQGNGFLIYYNRLGLEQLFGTLNLQIPNGVYATTHDLVPYLNTLYVDTYFRSEDFQDDPIPAGGATQPITLVAAANSYLVQDSCQLTLLGNGNSLQILTIEGVPLLTLENQPILIVE